MKVLVIPEDPRLDQHILKPVVEQLFEDLGKSPRVTVLSKPRLRGVAEALNPAILADIIATYPMNDLFLALVDRDGDSNRASVASAREREHPDKLFVCLAIEEVEVWMLAIHSDSLGTRWQDIRNEVHPKERFAEPFLRERAPKLDLGGGRAWAMQSLGRNWSGVLQRCDELGELKRKVQAWLATRS